MIVIFEGGCLAPVRRFARSTDFFFSLSLFFFLVSNKLIMDERLSDTSVVLFFSRRQRFF